MAGVVLLTIAELSSGLSSPLIIEPLELMTMLLIGAAACPERVPGSLDGKVAAVVSAFEASGAAAA